MRGKWSKESSGGSEEAVIVMGGGVRERNISSSGSAPVGEKKKGRNKGMKMKNGRRENKSRRGSKRKIGKESRWRSWRESLMVVGGDIPFRGFSLALSSFFFVF